MNRKRGFIVLILLLVFVIIGLVSYIIYDKLILDSKKSNEQEITSKKEENKAEEESSQEKINYTYLDMEGAYEFISDKYTGSTGNEGNDTFVLSLSKNGTFHYENSFYAGAGVLGNYTIENDTIHLNILFEHGSDAAVHVKAAEMKDIKIKSKDELVDNNETKSQSGKLYNNISLKRNETTNNEIDTLLNMYLTEIKNMIDRSTY